MAVSDIEPVEASVFADYIYPDGSVGVNRRITVISDIYDVMLRLKREYRLRVCDVWSKVIMGWREMGLETGLRARFSDYMVRKDSCKVVKVVMFVSDYEYLMGLSERCWMQFLRFLPRFMMDWKFYCYHDFMAKYFGEEDLEPEAGSKFLRRFLLNSRS